MRFSVLVVFSECPRNFSSNTISYRKSEHGIFNPYSSSSSSVNGFYEQPRYQSTTFIGSKERYAHAIEEWTACYFDLQTFQVSEGQTLNVFNLVSVTVPIEKGFSRIFFGKNSYF